MNQTQRLSDTLLEETRTGFSAIVELVSVHEARVRQAQDRIFQLEQEVDELKRKLSQVSDGPTDSS